MLLVFAMMMPAHHQGMYLTQHLYHMLQRDVYVSGDGSTFVAWCGLLINTANLELQADYTRYAGVQLASTLTVPLAKVLAFPLLCLTLPGTASMLSSCLKACLCVLSLSMSDRCPL